MLSPLHKRRGFFVIGFLCSAIKTKIRFAEHLCLQRQEVRRCRLPLRDPRAHVYHPDHCKNISY